MSVDVDCLVADLFEAFLELRKEIAILPAHERDDEELLRCGVLEDIIRSSPAPDHVRASLVERARTARGEEVASWLDHLLVRHEGLTPSIVMRLRSL